MGKKFVSVLCAIGIVLSVNITVFADNYLWPTPGLTNANITQYYSSSHKGLDIAAQGDNEVVAAREGTVIAAASTSCNHNGNKDFVHSTSSPTCNYGMGNYVQIKHSDGTYATYMHLRYGTVCVSKGQYVSRGDKIGIMGNSGNCNGSVNSEYYGQHLHFQVGYSSTNTINVNPSAIGYIYTNHSHSYTTKVSASSTHPHYSIYQCSCGATQQSTIETNYDANCVECANHTLFVNPNGGEWNGSDRTQTITKERNDLFTVPQPTRDGYSFTGWKMESFGTALFEGIMDSTNGNNRINVYNALGNGSVVHTYVDKPNDCPVNTTKILKISKNAGEASPKLGGFYHSSVATEVNKTFYQVIVAKIPKGYKINHGSNINGAATFTWVTSQEGTGEWETYIHKTVCNPSGSSHSAGIGFIYLDGSELNNNASMEWYVGYSNIFDGSDIKNTGAGLCLPYGWSMLPDAFNPLNSIAVYNNLGNGKVEIEKIFDTERPNTSIAKITTSGEASPSLGGFHQTVATSTNQTYYQVIVAKIPKGYTINHGSNINGAATFTWITSQEGTGEWETYIHKTVSHSTGSSNGAGIGYIYLDGPVATQDNPVTWYVESSNIFIATDLNQYADVYKFYNGNDMLTATWKKNSTIKPVKEIIYNNNRYELYEGNYSWSDAKKVCEERGGHLVTITDKNENDAITGLIQDAKDSQFWIGATNEENQAVWKWVSGEDFNYNNWATGVPDNGNGEFAEHYAQIYKNGTWNDAKDYVITSSRGFICEYENSENSTCITTLDLANIGKEKYKISSTVYNISNASVSGRGYIAVYNNQKKLLSLIDCGVIDWESKEYMGITKEITASAGDSVKVFVWDTNLKPLSKLVSATIDNILFN